MYCTAKLDDAYIGRLGAYLDPLFEDSDLPPYAHLSEGEYNKAVAAGDATIACLDTQNISPDGQTSVEPCDLLAICNGIANFYHVSGVLTAPFGLCVERRCSEPMRASTYDDFRA
jgi:uncharacterized protein (TIGR04141 family)